MFTKCGGGGGDDGGVQTPGSVRHVGRGRSLSIMSKSSSEISGELVESPDLLSELLSELFADLAAAAPSTAT